MGQGNGEPTETPRTRTREKAPSLEGEGGTPKGADDTVPVQAHRGESRVDTKKLDNSAAKEEDRWQDVLEGGSTIATNQEPDPADSRGSQPAGVPCAGLECEMNATDQCLRNPGEAEGKSSSTDDGPQSNSAVCGDFEEPMCSEDDHTTERKDVKLHGQVSGLVSCSTPQAGTEQTDEHERGDLNKNAQAAEKVVENNLTVGGEPNSNSETRQGEQRKHSAETCEDTCDIKNQDRLQTLVAVEQGRHEETERLLQTPPEAEMVEPPVSTAYSGVHVDSNSSKRDGEVLGPENAPENEPAVVSADTSGASVYSQSLYEKSTESNGALHRVAVADTNKFPLSSEENIQRLNAGTNQQSVSSEATSPQDGPGTPCTAPLETSTKGFSVSNCQEPEETPRESTVGNDPHTAQATETESDGVGTLVTPSGPTSQESAVKPNSSPSSGSDSYDPAADLRLAAALRIACKALPWQHILDIVTPNVTSLHLMRSLPSGESSLGVVINKLANLSQLDLSGNQLGPQGFRVICLAVASNATLKSLNLANNLADTDSSACVGTMVARNCSLESLDVSGNSLGKDYFSRCVGPALGQNKVLRTLKFSSCGASDVTAISEALLSEGGNNTLEEMDASSNQLGDSFGKGLAEILKRPDCSLKRVDVHRTDIGAEGMDALGSAIEANTSLTKINAGGNEVANVGSMMRLIAACVGHPRLCDINLENTKVLSNEDSRRWRESSVPPRNTVPVLRQLNLAGCSLNNDDLVSLAETVPGMFRALTSLTISNNQGLTVKGVVDRVYRSAINQGDQMKLECLDVSLNDAEDIAEVLQESPPLPALHTLNLKKCKIPAVSVGQLRGLVCPLGPGDGGLSSLILDGVKVSGTGALQTMLGNDSGTGQFTLSSLSLSGCSLNDRDVACVMVALGRGLELTKFNLSSNRLTDVTVGFMVENLAAGCALASLDFSMNKLRNSAAESLSTAIPSKLQQLTSLCLANNCIGSSGLVSLVRRLVPASRLCHLDLKNQQQPVGEEEMDTIFTTLAQTVGINLEDAHGACRDYPSLPPKFTLNLTGLGGLPGELGPKLDSVAVQTDYASRHRRTLTLRDALHISAALSSTGGQQQSRLSNVDWDLVIGADKGAPAWLQLASHRSCAVYISNLALSVTSEKLEGLLEDEADCNVKETYLVKDQILRKPTGVSWVLFCDEASVQRALDFYHSGKALIYGSPFTISPIDVEILADDEDSEHVEAAARLEIMQRSVDRKEEQTIHATLVQANYEETQARHQYAAQHPAYADGRVW